MFKFHSFFWLLFGLYFSSCGIKKTPDSCHGAICTTEFRMMTVKLVDSVGNDFIPDKVETYLSDSTLINSQTTAAIPGQNVYTIVDDGNREALGVNVENEVLFKVIKSNQIRKQQTFKVKADCCHIIKVSGDTVLIVN